MRKWMRERMRRRRKSPDTEQTGKIGQERPTGAAPLVPSYDFDRSPKPSHGEPRGRIEVETQPESLSSPPTTNAIPEPPKPAQKRAPRGVVVLTIGLPGSGKSTWYKRRGITPLSSDLLRTILFDNITEQRYQHLVFSTLRSLLRARLIAKMPWNYVDATNLSPHERKQWIKMAKGFGYEVQAVFFDVPLEVCLERNRRRERVVPDDIMQRMASKLKPPTFAEGFSKIVVVRVKAGSAASE
jgi:predicted kinase